MLQIVNVPAQQNRSLALDPFLALVPVGWIDRIFRHLRAPSLPGDWTILGVVPVSFVDQVNVAGANAAISEHIRHKALHDLLLLLGWVSAEPLGVPQNRACEAASHSLPPRAKV